MGITTDSQWLCVPTAKMWNILQKLVAVARLPRSGFDARGLAQIGLEGLERVMRSSPLLSNEGWLLTSRVRYSKAAKPVGILAKLDPNHATICRNIELRTMAPRWNDPIGSDLRLTASGLEDSENPTR